jgi:hypothetical protein
MSEQAKDHGVEEDASPDATGNLVDAVRHFTVQLLGQGTAPAQLSFALAFVSTEMGLHFTSSAHALGVFQTVLQAVTTAALNAPAEAQDVAEGTTTESAPASATLH